MTAEQRSEIVERFEKGTQFVGFAFDETPLLPTVVMDVIRDELRRLCRIEAKAREIVRSVSHVRHIDKLDIEACPNCAAKHILAAGDEK